MEGCEDSGITPRDLLRFRLASDPQLSPDGQSVAWVQTSFDPESNSYRSSIQVSSTVAGTTRRFTAGPRDTHPRWSPDGRWMVFRSSRGTGAGRGVVQLYLIPATGGEAHLLTDIRTGAGIPTWSPDSRHIAFTSRFDPGVGLRRFSEPDERDSDPYSRHNSDVLVVHRPRWKSDGQGFIGDGRVHIVVIDVDEDRWTVVPEPRLITGGAFDAGPPAWSPDGRTLAFIAAGCGQGDVPRSKHVSLVPAGADAPLGEEEILQLQGVRRLDGVPAWSPDGTSVAAFGHDSEISTYADTHLFLFAVDGSGFTCPTVDLGRSLGDRSVADNRGYACPPQPVWCDGGDALLAQMSDSGSVHVVSVPAGGGRIDRLSGGGRQALALSYCDADDRVAAIVSDPGMPGDVYTMRRGGGTWSRLTRLNDALLEETGLSEMERVSVTADDGVEIEGWVMRPLGFRPGCRYPAVLQIHGGPVRQYGYTYMNEFQILAAHGYAVIFCNPRGSQGYGEAFSAAIREDRGNRDYRDIMQFTDGALERFDFINPDRLGVAGGSYGGFMTNWIIGHTDRFRAAVSMRSSVFHYAAWGTGDRGLTTREREHGGHPPWEDQETWLSRSPVHHIGGCTTPTMVIHSDRDLRCPVDQGELLYAALFRVGVPTEMVRFSGESHDLSRSGRPWHRVFRLEKILEWFDRWLTGDSESEGGG
ncbi:MAG: S9 family peptidase [Bacillota bacterium]